MIPLSLENLIKGRMPKMNPEVTSGFVKHEMDNADVLIDRVFRGAFESLCSNITYVGMQRCKPEEEYRFNLKRNGGPSNAKGRYELARSDIFLTKVLFEVDGHLQKPTLLYIPYCDDTGLTHLRGTAHTISPVLEDPGVSVTRDGCFFRVACDKIVVKRIGHTYCKDELNILQKIVTTQKHVNIPYGKIYRAKAQKANSAKSAPVTTLPHYLFAKYGVTYVYKHFANVEVVFGYDHEITEQTHPSSEWSRYYSAKQPPSGNKAKRLAWQASHVALAVKTTTPSTLVEILTAGYFYVADYASSDFMPEYSDNLEHWVMMMGRMVFNKTVKFSQMLEYLAPHFASLDTYLDEMTRESLLEEGVAVDNIYELFVFIIMSLDQMINNVNLASMYGKKLSILPYLLSPIIHGIFFTKFNLMQLCKVRIPDPETGEEKMIFTERNLQDVLTANLKPEAIYNIKKSEYGFKSSLAAPGDNKMFKILSKIVLQQNAIVPSGRSNESPMLDMSKSLDASIADGFCYLHVTKPEPTGRAHMSPWKVLVKGKFKPNPVFQDVLSKAQAIITRRNI